MRHITFTRAADRYVGTLYARGAEKVDFTLTVEINDPGAAAREFSAPVRRLSAIRAAERQGPAVRRLRQRRSPSSLPAAITRSSSARRGSTSRPIPPALANRLGIGAPAGGALVAHAGQILDQAAVANFAPRETLMKGVGTLCRGRRARFFAPAAARADMKALEEAARKEGELTWYTAHYTSEAAEELGAGFTRIYGIKVNVARTSTQVAYQRLPAGPQEQPGRLRRPSPRPMSATICG